MALSAFTAQQGVSAGSSGHIGDHNEIRSQIQEILDELLLYRQGRRNAIRNGDMGVAQRGAGNWTAVLEYTVDGWVKGHNGGTQTVSRQVATLGLNAGVNGAPASLQSVVASQAAAGDYAYLSARIENVRSLAGKEVTLSFIAAASSGTPKIGVEAVQYFGTGGTPSADVQTAVSAITISTVYTRYTVTFTIPNINGKTVGTNNNDYLTIIFWLSAGSNLAARASSIGIQNTTINITDVQLEQGSGSPFERLSQAEQLAWCQRYYWRGTGAEVSAVISNANNINADIIFPVSMRVTPTLGNSALSHVFSVIFVGGTLTVSQAIAGGSPSVRRAHWMYSQTALGGSVGQLLILTGTSWLDATAEL